MMPHDNNISAHYPEYHGVPEVLLRQTEEVITNTNNLEKDLSSIIKTSDYVITGLDRHIAGDCSSNSIVFTLPDASNPFRVSIKKLGAQNTLTIAPVMGQKIDNQNSYIISTENLAVTLVSTGLNWLIY